MGGGSSVAVKEAQSKNKIIEKQLVKDRLSMGKTVKLLLLGAAESGKSTILKQMKILHSDGFSEQEIKDQKSIIYSNVITGMADMLAAMRILGIGYAETHRYDDQKIVEAAVMQVKEKKTVETLSKELTTALRNLWADQGVIEVYDRRNEYLLNETVKYYLDVLDRIAIPEYKPTQDDILHSRAQTVGIVEIHFLLKNLIFRVFDVGGQRSERRKWIHCFEDVNAIIFITSMSEYDQQLAEDTAVNRMQESLFLFGSIANNKWFVKTSIITFFNKKDLFAEKIKKRPITLAFPEYAGVQEYNASAQYIGFKFQGVNKNVKKTIFTHQTCGTDTNQVQLVLENVIEMIVSANLSNSGMS